MESEKSEEVKCACGQPLHYSDLHLKELVDEMVREFGPEINVVTPYGTWKVPKHFIALHGLKARELPQLAEQYGFTKV